MTISSDFEQWLASKTTLSESSQYKYLSAIKGSISKCCSEYGITKANLLEVKEPELFEEIRYCLNGDKRYIQKNTKGNDMYKRAMDYYMSFLEDLSPIIANDDLYKEAESHPIVTTESLSLITARKGQGSFRQALEELWDRKCSVTRTPDSDFGSLLIASHIKPWTVSTNNERLDKFNGLLLTPNLDKAFDKGYISFQDSGEIVISSKLQGCKQLGITPSLRLSLDKITSKHREYLQYHRKNIYLDA